MSRRRRNRADGAYGSVYAPFLNNPSRNRKTMLEIMYRRILTELSVNRFKWVGLPSTVDERFLEMTLFRQAFALFYFDRDYDAYFAVRATGTNPNLYDNPTRFRTYGVGLYKAKTLTSREAVPIWSNYTRTPDWDIIEIYSTQLAELHRTIEINSLGQRHSHVVAVPESQRLTFQNLMRQQQEGEPYIFGTNDLDLGAIQAFSIGIDKEMVLNGQVAKSKVWNECMNLLGIMNNPNQDKKERMVTDEVNANEEQVVAARGVSLNARRQAVEIINQKFDLNINVGWNDQAAAMASEPTTLLGIGMGR